MILRRSSVEVTVDCGKTPHKTPKELQANLELSGVVVSVCATCCNKPSQAPWAKAKEDTSTAKEKTQKARLMCAKTFIDKPQSFWDNIL